MNRLQTKISKAFWCDSNGNFLEAKAPKIKFTDESHQKETDEQDNSICWLDELFEGGIALPQYTDGNRALTILLTGTTGTGKSSLALELCYRLAIKDDGLLHKKGKKGLSSLYITSEANDQWAIQKAEEMRWDKTDRTIFPDGEITSKFSLVSILEATNVKRYLEGQSGYPKTLSFILNSLTKILHLSPSDEMVKEHHDNKKSSEIRKKIQLSDPDILVIDSLNIVEPSKRSELFNRFSELITFGPHLIITVLESSDKHGAPEYWEYLSDIVIRLDRKRISGYMVRTIEIVKARYQSHIWGTHQLKFVQPDQLSICRDIIEKKRAHPYRTEGGLFIHPSIHYYLSAYKRKTPKSISGRYGTSIDDLDELLQDGFPKGRCTGLIGMRGGHKSHLGYLTILHQVTRKKEDQEPEQKALIISLRDDEGMARHTMNGILSTELNETTKVKNLEKENKIDILYYPPGYVTPEEFFHRMFMSIQRLKYGDGDEPNDVIVLFNSLDQLSSRFPLCANEQIFIPGIIETLSAENISSIFIGVEEPGQPREQYGLLSMADALVAFTRKKLTKEAYVELIAKEKNLKEEQKTQAISSLPDTLNPIVMEIIRFSGGQAAGDRGILELIHKADVTYALFDQKAGLNLIPLQKTKRNREPKAVHQTCK